MVTVAGTPGFKGGAKQTLSTRGSNRGLDPGDKQAGGKKGEKGAAEGRGIGQTNQRGWEK